MKHNILRVVALIGIAVALLIPIAAYAVDPPDSDPSVSYIKVNRMLLNDDDALIYGDYDLPYGEDYPSDVPASEAYVFRLLDGTDEIGAIRPFVLFDNGYNKGGFSFYFEDGLEWNEPYTIRVSQNPTHFASPESWDFVMLPTAYSTKATQAENQDELTINIIAMAQRLQAAHPLYTLLEDSPGGTVLSSPTGELYFRGIIYGVQAMASALFLVQVLGIGSEEREWTTEQFDEYTQRFADTWVGEGTEAGAEQFGVTPQTFTSLLFVLPVCIGAIILSSMKWKKAEPGFVICFVVILCFAIMGWFPLAVFATLFQLMAIYVGYVVFYARG